MKKRQVKKKKKTSRTPPLSRLDKGLYIGLIVVTAVCTVVFSFAVEDVRSLIAFRDQNVLASAEHSSVLLILPLLLYLEISALTFLIGHLSVRTPIFGNKRIPYGCSPWAKDCFPLFDPRRKTVYKRPSARQFHKAMRTVWCVGCIPLLLIAPLGLFGRDCLDRAYNVSSYNVWNQPEAVSYSVEEFARLSVATYYVTHYRGGGYWKYEIGIEMDDGKVFRFSNRDFDWRKENDKDLCLQTMSEIKQRFPADRITVSGAQNVDRVAAFLGLNNDQTRLLHELFS